ncbi:hypothetical protein [Methylocella sp.]|jgi:hypothetical protein|uniref:hypothetical protein n=1 Tax=Methylocella sp. TaxID=1978226 RepID=UPI003C26C112
MSEPVTTWRPLIEFDEGERRFGRPETAHADEGEAFAEIIRFAGDRSESASGYEAAAEDGALDSPAAAPSPAQVPVIRGDFAAIEAALLGAARPGAAAAEPAELRKTPPWARFDLRASRADAETPAFRFPALSADGPDAPDAPQQPAPLLAEIPDAAFYPDAGAPSDNFILFDDAAVSGNAAITDEDKRSRRPIYIMAALVLAGIAGMTATSFRRDGSGEISQEASKPTAIAPVAAETAAAPSTQSAEASPEPSAAPPAQQASTAGVGSDAQSAATAPSQPAPAADAAPRVISLSKPAGAPGVPVALPPVPPAPSELATGSILEPPAPGKAQILAEPSVKAAMGDAKKVKTAAVRPDGSLVNAEPPATKPAPQEALNKELPAKTPLARDASVKAAKVAHLKTPHPGSAAAKTAAATNHAKPTAVATVAKPKPATGQDAQLAQPAPAQQAAAAQPPAPATAGPLAFVDTAVNSITGATGKLLDWGRTASSGVHN